MKLELVDSLSLPGNAAKPNDDAFGHVAGAAVVLDGATGLGASLMPGQSDAAWLAHFGAERLMFYSRVGRNARMTLNIVLNEAEHAFVTERSRPPAQTWEIPFASMMFVTANADGLAALWYGDCAALAKRPGEALEIVGEAFDRRANESARVARLAANKGLAPAASSNLPEFLPSLRRARNFVNSGEHWLFGPDARAADHVRSLQVAAPAGTLILLCTDGFLALASDYGAYDAEGLIAAAQAKGLAALGDELRAIENSDADGTRFPRFKTSDDATAVLLRVG
jgi:hypothetical protein